MVTKPPVLFVHGLWLHASSWQPWLEHFARAGYEVSAPGWPGDAPTVEASRQNPDAIANHGVDEVTAHLAGIIDAMPVKPIVIGHSFGGLLAQKLLGEDRAAGAVGLDAAQMQGVLPLPLSALRSSWPALGNPANLHKAVSLSREQFRFAFGNAVSEEESDALYEQWTIPAPAKPLFEAASANFRLHAPTKVETGNEARGPLLLVTGGKDHTVPEAVVKAEYKQYRHSEAVTELMEFADRGHSLSIDSGWREVADAVLAWLDKQGL